MVDDKGIGLVLAGGGAKGAYQVGVWQALCEMGLDRIITGMSGSSIGAINALLFSSVGLDAARQVWMEATEDVFLAPRIDEDGDGLPDKGLKHALRESAGGMAPLLPHKAARKDLDDVADSVRSDPEEPEEVDLDAPQVVEMADRLLAAITESMTALKAVGALGKVSSKAKAANQRRAMQGLYSNRNLASLVNRTVPDRLQLSRTAFACVFDLMQNAPRYVDLGAASRDHAVDAVLASACLPGIYAPMELDGVTVCDGGVGDNRPIKPLYDAGWRRFIVVHLNGIARKGVRDMLAADQERFPDAAIVPILPGEEFDDSFMGGTMNVNPKASSKRIALGYEETLRQFSTLGLFPELSW